MVRIIAVAALASLFVPVPAGAQSQERRRVPQAVACNSENETCRENCTIEFGSSIRARKKLGVCLNKCRTRHSRCTEQWTELHRNNLDPSNAPPPVPEPAPQRTRYAEETPTPKDEAEASGEDPKPKKKPEAEAEAAAKPDPAPSKDALPPEPKYDISEWDPNGD